MDLLEATTILTWVIVGQSTLLCALLLTRKTNTCRNFWFAGFVACLCFTYSSWLLQPLFIDNFISANIIMLPFALLVGPFLYLSAYCSDQKVSPSTYWHFAPSLLSIVVLSLLSQTISAEQFNINIMYGAIYIHQLCYLSFIIYQDRIVKNGKMAWNTGLFPWVWQLSFILFIMIMLDLTYVYFLPPNMLSVYFIELVFEVYLFLCAFRVMGDMTKEGAEKSIGKYLKSSLDRDTANIFSESIEAAMKRDQLFLEPGLSLTSLANHMGMATHHVSEILNTCIGMKFYDYVNYWRVQHAVTLLKDTNMTVLSIAMQSGFNNKVSFHKAFKKWLDCTPSAYRKIPSPSLPEISLSLH